MHSYIEQATEQGNTMEVDAITLLMISTLKALPDGNDDSVGNIQARLSPVLHFMTGDIPFTHQLGVFMKECQPYCIEWYPELDANFEGMNETNYRIMLNVWLAENPATFTIAPIPADDHTQLDPYESLAEMLKKGGRNPEDVIIEVNLDDFDEDEL